MLHTLDTYTFKVAKYYSCSNTRGQYNQRRSNGDFASFQNLHISKSFTTFQVYSNFQLTLYSILSIIFIECEIKKQMNRLIAG